ncbi:Imm43 family immunity protein [Paraburkholderia flava]|uniref:Imm43 family immunity protein n=1 Tax=Paraburkholderia flava TaxID=2547393 RepID=UPI00106205D3|nr:hypothetical protein [Paraburkholderia flava]
MTEFAKENLYVVSAKLNDWVGSAEFQPDIQLPWNNVSIAQKIDTEFHMNIKWKRLKRLDFDYFRNVTPIVSQKFADLCHEQSVDCQLAPLRIILNGDKLDGIFHFLLLNRFISIVDASQTSHARMMTLDGKNYEMNRFFPEIPEYDMLENIAFNESEKPPFFMAPEIGNKRVCTQRFKDSAERNKMKGIEFKKIDENFKYRSLSFQ